VSSPQDPNQGPPPGWGAPPPPPAQPGWGTPPTPPTPPTQPGWGTPPTPPTPPTQPGWGAPPTPPTPPTQPGWGAPPPPPAQPGWGTPPTPPTQPGWGAPPGYQQPGWGPPPQGPGYPGWGQQGWAPQPTRSNKKGCLIALGLFLVLIAVLVGGCAVVIAPIFGTDMKLQQDLGSRAVGVSFNWNNGLTTFSITLAPGEETQAKDITCHIVRPDIASSSTPNAHFVIYSARGDWLADDTTPCP
jgi:hypothetical protein